MLYLKTPAYNKIPPELLRWPTIVWHNFCTFLLWVWLKTCFRMRVQGKEHIPKKTCSFVTISNHTSMVDVPVMAVVVWPRPIGFMAKQELFKHPIAARYFHAMGTFSVNRDKLELASIKSALTILKSNRWLLGLFPEGTRSEADETGIASVGKAKRGTAYLAHAAQVPILPMGIARMGPDRKDIFVCVGALIPYHEDLNLMTETVEGAIRALSSQAREWGQQVCKAG